MKRIEAQNPETDILSRERGLNSLKFWSKVGMFTAAAAGTGALFAGNPPLAVIFAGGFGGGAAIDVFLAESELRRARSAPSSQ